MTQKKRQEDEGSGRISAPFTDRKEVYEQTYNGGPVPDVVASPVGKDTDDGIPVFFLTLSRKEEK